MTKNKRQKVLYGVILILVLLIGIAPTALARTDGYGAIGAQKEKELTIEKMLVYAVQDEYLAKAEYEKIISKYGSTKPFSSIVKTEDRHISLLLPLFKNYKVSVPENTSKVYVSIPSSLTNAYKAGVIAEKNNIAMYDRFLKEKLPSDVKTVFLELKRASENHLKAFSRKL